MNRAVPRHDCLGALALPRGGRTERQAPAAKYMLQMELKAKSEPKEYSEKSGSAHQFSARSMSIQADSEERDEINM